MSGKIKLVERLSGGIRDGLRNVVSGLGVSGQDKSTASRWTLPTLSRPDLDACYLGTWLGRKLHDIPAKDMTREWRAWQAEDNQIEAIEKEEQRLNVRRAVRKALILARLYGGGAIVMGLPGDPATPAPTTIGKGGLRYIHVMHRHNISLGDQDRDLESMTFGRPTAFRLQSDLGPEQRIHPSRVITFLGNERPDGAIAVGEGESWFWGDPVLMAVSEALMAHDTGVQAISALLQEAKVDVIHVPGLMDNVTSSEYESTLIQRFTLASVMKSITNTLILDGGDGSKESGEQWETRQVKWEGLPDIQRTLFQLVAGACDIPATRLIGQSPTGMNATGDSDTRNYYDMLSSEQESELTPAISPLDEYVIQSATGARDQSIYYEWNPLWQMTPKEKADRDKTKAETVQVYANLGVIPNDAFAAAVANTLIEDGVFPGLEAALEEAELEADILGEEIDPVDPAVAANPNAPPKPANDPEPMAGNSRRRAANDRARRMVRDRLHRDRDVADSTPRPLYVSRKVLNGAEIAAWAEEQGFKSILAPADMHVTVAASREAVDWMKVGADMWGGGNDGKIEVAPGGPRVVEPLGKAIVLLFNSSDLSWRHESIGERGASWDFAEYQPHISISYDAEANADLDLSKIKPFTGAIRLGPEIFEEFNADPLPVAAE